MRVAVVADPPMTDYPELPRHNFIDELAFSKLRKLNIIPSRLSSDEEFLRRVYLDTVAVLPTVDEAEEFLTSSNPNKRAELIDQSFGASGVQRRLGDELQPGVPGARRVDGTGHPQRSSLDSGVARAPHALRPDGTADGHGARGRSTGTV